MDGHDRVKLETIELGGIPIWQAGKPMYIETYFFCKNSRTENTF